MHTQTWRQVKMEESEDGKECDVVAVGTKEELERFCETLGFSVSSPANCSRISTLVPPVCVQLFLRAFASSLNPLFSLFSFSLSSPRAAFFPCFPHRSRTRCTCLLPSHNTQMTVVSSFLTSALTFGSFLPTVELGHALLVALACVANT